MPDLTKLTISLEHDILCQTKNICPQCNKGIVTTKSWFKGEQSFICPRCKGTGEYGFDKMWPGWTKYIKNKEKH